MEELLGLIVQGAIEFVLEFVFYYLFDRPRSGSGRKDQGFPGWLLVYLVLGTGLGAAVNWVHPQLLIANPWIRLANLLVAPLLSGWLSQRIAGLRALKDANIAAWKHFYYAAVFTLGFALVRFLFGQH